GDNIPVDAVEITQQQHTALLQGQSEGKVITADENGRPVLADPPIPTQQQLSIARIFELKKLLSETDYKVMPDYDRTDETILAQRQLWREEIRSIESSLNKE